MAWASFVDLKRMGLLLYWFSPGHARGAGAGRIFWKEGACPLAIRAGPWYNTGIKQDRRRWPWERKFGCWRWTWTGRCSTGQADHPPDPGGAGAGQAAGGSDGACDRPPGPGSAAGGAVPAGAAVRGHLQRGHHSGPGGAAGAAGKASGPCPLLAGAGPVRPHSHDPAGVPGGGGLSLPAGL